MRLTKSELEHIIKEELSSVLNEKAQTYTFTIDKGGKVVKVHKLGKDAATRAFKKLARMHGKKSVSVQPPLEELEERCQKGYKTHPTRKTKKMFGRTYRNCVKAEGLDEEEEIEERELKPGEKKRLKSLEKKIPKDDFTDRYGKEGESIYYATLTKMAKKGKKK